MVPLLRGFAHVIGQPFARISGRGHRLRLWLLGCLLGLLLGVVVGSLGTCLGLQQVLDQEVIIIIYFLLGPLRSHS